MVASAACMEAGGPMFVVTQRETETRLGSENLSAANWQPLSQGHLQQAARNDRQVVSERLPADQVLKSWLQLQTLQQLSPLMDPALSQLAAITVGRDAAVASSEKNWGERGGEVAWWKCLSQPLVCPLSHCPIAMLPYPPFKLRLDPQKPSPYKLVDGRFLALQIVATGYFCACGRELKTSDVKALDEYIRRCKLGPFRPGRALALAQEIQSAKTLSEQLKAADESSAYSSRAKAELKKLRKIQGNRLKSVNVEDSAGVASERICGRKSSGAVKQPVSPTLTLTSVPSSLSIMSGVDSLYDGSSSD